jgi:hypothetical protein
MAWLQPYTGLGDKDQAFRWLNESLKNHEGWMMFLKVDPQWESLRGDPRFDDLLRRLGLADKAAEQNLGIHSIAVLPKATQPRMAAGHLYRGGHSTRHSHSWSDGHLNS